MAEIIGRVGWKNYVSPLPTIWNNLTHYYSADNTAIDSKGSIHGTLVNGATYSTGKINAGFGLDGVNDYVNVGNLFGFDGTTPFSISFIFKLNANIANYSIKYLVGNQTRTAFPTNGTGVYLYTGDGGATNRLGFAMANNGNRLVVYIKNNLAINTFYHCVVSYNGNGLNSGLNTYINGVSEKLSVFSNSLTLPISSSSQLSTFGSTLGTSDFFNGVIDEVGVWDRALSTTDVTELYNAGAGKQYVAPAPTYTTRTAAFAAATGITDATILNALNTFDTGLISNGLDTDLEALYPFVGSTSTSHQYNFINPSTFPLTFNGGWIHSSTGAKPNGTNAYAQTGWVPSSRYSNGLTNGAWGTYIRQSLTAWPQFALGAYSAGSYFGLAGNNTTSQYWRVNGEANTTPATTSNKGMFQASRALTSTNMFVSQNSQQFELSGILANGGIPNVEVYLSSNNNGGAVQFGSQEQALAYLSKGKYTQAQQATFYTLVQAFQTSLSRQV